MVEITVSNDNFTALMGAHTNERAIVRHKSLKGEVCLEKKYDKQPSASDDCVVVDEAYRTTFERRVTELLNNGYMLSSSSCTGAEYKAIMIKEDHHGNKQ